MFVVIKGSTILNVCPGCKIAELMEQLRQK
jgi:hypothetical protein